MAALWIARVDVNDAELYAKYIDVASVVIPDHGGEFIARGGRVEQLEGQGRARNVVARFPSVDAAVECYNSPEYQAALDHARGASERELMVVETSD